MPLDNTLKLAPESKIYVAGHRGLAGSAVWRRLQKAGFSNLVGASSNQVDLRDRAATFDFITSQNPDVIVLAAARVGGIYANSTYPADFLSDNLQIQINVMDAARENQVDRLLFLGSSCIYPKFAEQPIKESSLLTGELESTNDAYAIAKIAGIIQVQSVRRQDGLRWISAMPTNLYGPGDSFDPMNSHVLPALIRRFHEAVLTGASEVVLWGTGSPRREFLHVDDLADALVFLLENYDDPLTINVGVGDDLTIRELADLIAKESGFHGQIIQDLGKPDGTPQKLLDVSRLSQLGWTAKIALNPGIRSTIDWYQQEYLQT
jgi:GDP-L-fucose synthase